MWAQPQWIDCMGCVFLYDFIFAFRWRSLEPKMNKSLACSKNECVPAPVTQKQRTSKITSNSLLLLFFFFAFGCVFLRHLFGRGSLIHSIFFMFARVSECNSQTVLCPSLFDFFLQWSLPWSIDGLFFIRFLKRFFLLFLTRIFD